MRIRAIEPEDVDFILECENDPESAKWSDYKAPFSRNQLLTYALTYDADPFSAGQIRLIVETEAKERLSVIDFYEISEKDGRAYIGITIHPDYRNKNLGADIIRTAIKYAEKRLGLNQIAAKISTQNIKALKLFENSGFKSLCILPQWHKIGPSKHDFHLLLLHL